MVTYKEPFTKDHPVVKEAERTAHKQFVDQLLRELEIQGSNKNKITHAIGAEAPMTYRTLNVDSNITLNTMVRYAGAIGKAVEIKLVDAEENGITDVGHI